MAGSSPLVSVILPACRRADFVNQAIDSVARQTFTDYELLVIDDGSGDDIVAQYRLPASARLIRRAANSGGAATPRNDGIAEARGKYLAFLDMDDVCLPEKLATQVATLEAHPNVGMTFCHYTLVDEALGPLPAQRPPARLPADTLRALLHGNLIRTPSQVLARRQDVEAAGCFDTALRSAEDWDLWLRLAARTAFHADPVPNLLFRRHAGQHTADRARICQWSLRVLEKTGTWLGEEHPSLLPHWRRALTRQHYRQAKIQIADRVEPPVIYHTLKHAVAGNPFALRTYQGFVRLAVYALKRWAGG
ncbi:MAG: glycosyltransferase family 2 protein [Armatimonadota bacterium]